MNLSPSFWAIAPRLYLEQAGDASNGAAAAEAKDGAHADTSGNGGAQGEQQNAEPTKAEAIVNSDGKTVTIDGRTFVMQDHVNHLVGTARTEGKTAAAAELERKRTEQEAKDKGQWEELANQRQARIAELEAEAAKREREELKRTVGKKHNLPDEAIVRLQGDDETALEADAKVMAKMLGSRKAPDTEAGTGNGSTPPVSDRPIEKKVPAGTQQVPGYTFSGQPKVSWPG